MAAEKTIIQQHDGAAHTLEELKHTQTIDTIHQDEALRVLAQYAGDETWTPEEEKKLVRRVDRKLMSLLIVTYGLQYCPFGPNGSSITNCSGTTTRRCYHKQPFSDCGTTSS
jgi:hypothetical protein